MIKCNLKTILKERNLTQKELCSLIDARPSTICDLCNNNADYIKLPLLYHICMALDCSISDIFSII